MSPSISRKPSDLPENFRFATEEEMQWWRDAKFGMFIHWGPASIGGGDISWCRKGGERLGDHQFVADPQIGLGRGMILLGGWAKPLHCLHSIPRRPPLASIESLTQFILGLGVSGCRIGAEICQFLAVTFALLGSE